MLRHLPTGAEKLGLRIMSILTPTEGNPSPGLVATVKGLLSERQLDPRFMIPIAGEMDKVSFASCHSCICLLTRSNIGGAISISTSHGFNSVWQGT